MRKLPHALKWSHVTVYLPWTFTVSSSLVSFRPVDFHNGSGLDFTSASLFEHVSMDQTVHPPMQGITLRAQSCSDALLAVQPPHGLAHDISQAPPHLGAPFLLFDAVRAGRSLQCKRKVVPQKNIRHTVLLSNGNRRVTPEKNNSKRRQKGKAMGNY